MLVKAGQTTSVRSGDNSAPLPPTQAALSLLTTAVTDTNVGGGAGALQTAAEGGAHISKGMVITLGVLAVIPAVVVPIASEGKQPNYASAGAVPAAIAEMRMNGD